MNNKDIYAKVFMEALEIDESQLPGLEYMAVPAWDSVGHMSLIAMLEDAFNIQMETDDIIDFSSYEKGMEILGTKYGVEF